MIEIVNATIIRHMNLHGCTYPYISLPYHEVEAHREKEKGRFNVHLNGASRSALLDSHLT